MMKKNLIRLLAVILACGVFTSCKGNTSIETKHVKGTMEQPLGADSVPQAVADSFLKTEPTTIDNRFEAILGDKNSKVSVWGLMKCSDEQSSEGYGVMIVKDGIKTTLGIRHGNVSRAYYDESNDELWFAGAVVEGTGVLITQLYLIKFNEDGKASIVATITPYDMQEEICKRLSYSIKGEEITFYADGKPLTTVTNTVKDMGGFYEDAIWIGEQLTYEVDKKLTVQIVPGVSFNVGKILIYDDMPEIAADVTLNTDNSFTLSDLRVVEE